MGGEAVCTTCPYCGVGCGVLATLDENGSVSVKGDDKHPANFGRLCSKGTALGETVDLDGRLLSPSIDGTEASWDQALDLVAEKFKNVIADHGPDSVAFYVSGQILTEDYYVANKLMKGFIGAANIDTNSRLCMASSVAGHRRAFGTDTVPGCYEDLELADLVVLTGSNLAWCHPVLFQRLAAAKEARPGMKIVLIDPRRTMTADLADIHLAIKPDSDVALFGGLLKWLVKYDTLDQDWINDHTNGFSAAFEAIDELSLKRVAELTGLAQTEIASFYELWTSREKTVTAYSQGVNQSASGTDKVNAIINCHLATGRIGKPGMGPLSLTGQPNAMGGRETGGLANMLAAHMDLENDAHRDIVQRFWTAPTMAEKAGLKAVDLFKACADGKIKALWIMATNPVDSMPDADAVRAAISNVPFVAVSDIMTQTDTTILADVLLPSLGWGEKDGTVTNSERRVSRQRGFLPAPGEAKPDWWQMAQIGQRLGFEEAFSWPDAAAVYREYAALTAFENQGARDLDIGAHAEISNDDYDQMQPYQWPLPSDRAPVTSRFFAEGGFFTPDRKARFQPTMPPVPVALAEDEFVLNTGRVRDHWHTMTRTAKSARLSQHMGEPYAEIHPEDAIKLGVNHAELLVLENQYGRMVGRVLITDRQQKGSVFVPMHWTDQFASAGRIDALVAPQTDPFSGQPASKQARVKLKKMDVNWFGYAVSTHEPELEGTDYWAKARAGVGWRMELAGCDQPVFDEARLRKLFGITDGAIEMIAVGDVGRGDQRFAIFADTKLLGALIVSSSPVGAARSWLAEQLDIDHQDKNARWRIVAARPGAGMPDKGAIVCACMQVGANDIARAVAKGCTSIAAVGEATGAGTNCGSCKAEIKEFIHDGHAIAAE